MEIRGIGFVGSHTTAHVEMGAFLRDVLGLTPIAIDGVGAELFAASNGDVLAVAPPYEEDGSMERTIGLIVDDLDGAIAELHAAGVETDGISENARWRYSHFRMPDGKLYELVEERARREQLPSRAGSAARQGAGSGPSSTSSRATNWKPAFSSTRREPALCSTTVASRGRCRSTSR